jgi:hypothetical protein
MEDILSQGEDRGPSQGPRRLTVIAALIAVLAGGAIYLGVARHPAPRPAAHRPLITATPPTATPAPVPPALSLPAEPDGIAGQTLAWDRNLRLPVAGARPVWFSPASGRSEPIAGLPADKSGYQFIRVAGGWAVQASSLSPAGCGGCAGPPAQVWFLADGAGSVTRLGTASLVAPALTAGGVWLTSYRQGAVMTSAAGTAREASTAGTMTRPVTLPPGYRIVRETGRGLLLTPVGELLGAAPSLLWDPAARKTSRVFDRVLAASPDEIAWASGCVGRCGVQVLNLATGRHTVVTLPAGSSAASGVFSPDGDFLALQVSFGNTGDGGELAMQLEVAAMTSGRLTVVPGTWASSDAFAGFGWPARGDSLVAEFSFMTKVQLASWRPGASRPAVTVIRPGPSQASLILG